MSRARAHIYRVADPGWRAGINRVCGHAIGVYAVLGSRCVSLVFRAAPDDIRRNR